MAGEFDRSVFIIVGVAGILLSTATVLALARPLDQDIPGPLDVADSASPGERSRSANSPVAASAEPNDREEAEVAPSPALNPGGNRRIQVLGHYPAYAAHHLAADRIPYDRLTHISYFSLLPRADGSLDKSEVSDTDLAELVSHADANGVETIVVVGGWGRSTHFRAMAANPDARTSFAANLRRYCLDRNLAGVDLDWEPVPTAWDRTNYTLLVERVSREFKSFGLSLAVSVSAYGHEILPEGIDFVDSLNVMAYDGTPPHHSTFDFAVSALEHWEDYGAPRAKLMLGVPFYGKSSSGTGYAYRDIVDTYHPAPESDFVGGIGFNGISTISDKTAYVVNNGYRGIMIWEITQDTADDSSLLKAVDDTITSLLPANLNGIDSVDFHDFQLLASVWQTGPNNNVWNPLYDISQPQDGVIDNHDLAAFCGSWLAGR